MKHLLIFAESLIGFNASAQLESPSDFYFSAAKSKSVKVASPISNETSLVPGLLIGVGLLPNHQISRNGTTSTPRRVQVMGTRLY